MLFSATLRKRSQARSGLTRQADTVPRPFVPLIEPVATGLLPRTQVATARGWLPVGRLRPGDMVLTFDHGTQPLRDLIPAAPEAACSPADERAVLVPTGALENRSPMVLLPGQAVLLESDHAEEMFGDPFALLPAAALIDLRGITAVDMPDEAGFCPHFDHDQILYAHGSALLFCPGYPTVGAADPAQAPLAIRDARNLVERLIEEEGTADAPQERGISGAEGGEAS